jgi:hypothetical protein
MTGAAMLRGRVRKRPISQQRRTWGAEHSDTNANGPKIVPPHWNRSNQHQLHYWLSHLSCCLVVARRRWRSWWLTGGRKEAHREGRAAHRRMENHARRRQRSDEKETLDRLIALLGVWLSCCVYVRVVLVTACSPLRSLLLISQSAENCPQPTRAMHNHSIQSIQFNHRLVLPYSCTI